MPRVNPAHSNTPSVYLYNHGGNWTRRTAPEYVLFRPVYVKYYYYCYYTIIEVEDEIYFERIVLYDRPKNDVTVYHNACHNRYCLVYASLSENPELGRHVIIRFSVR